MARINSVSYIGWRGIDGCEVLELHEYMTGFVGPGGAGKSTLLIALDYALLPDRKALNIRPISEIRDSTTSGLDPLVGWISPDYGYAYVVLDIRTRQGVRLITGIHVEAIKDEVKLSPWIMNGVPEDLSVPSLMAITNDEDACFPDILDLRRHLAEKGIDLIKCRSQGEYGQILYDAGILPSAMNQRADRRLFANLVEATFRGGASQEVTARLKDYLLQPPTQLREIVSGLQDCTTELLKTRSAINDAKRELKILDSTYGFGKALVITALRGITGDIDRSRQTANSLESQLSGNRLNKANLENTIPVLREEISLTERLKKSSLENAIALQKEIAEKKDHFSEKERAATSELREAEANLKRFKSGHSLWRSIAGRRHEHGFQRLLDHLEGLDERISRKLFQIDEEKKTLLSEYTRLSKMHASRSSEVLAAKLSSKTLESSLDGVSSEESMTFELALGGLVEGVIGADDRDIAKLRYTKDIPDRFWFGNRIPTPAQSRLLGDWLVAELAGGHIATNRNHAPLFGASGREARRQAIGRRVDVLARRHSSFEKARRLVRNKLEKMRTERADIDFYLSGSTETPDVFDKAQSAGRYATEMHSAYMNAWQEHNDQTEKIKTIQEPYDKRLKSLNIQLHQANSDLNNAIAIIEQQERLLADARDALELYLSEMASAEEILGPSHSLDPSKSQGDESPNRVIGIQARRLGDLSVGLGDLVSRMPSLPLATAEDRISVVRIWPELLGVVREIVSTEIADSDGEDLIQRMDKRRSALDADLERQEKEVRVKSRNLNMHINTSIRAQKSRIEKLNNLGGSICFGNVTGIRIKLVEREKMIDVLGQLPDQMSLFTPEKTIEESLREFFDVTSHREIQMDGRHLLDYRNYVDLVIEARRVKDDWKPAASLSNTEAIGSGLALALMLIRSMALHGEDSGELVRMSDIRPLFAVDEVGRINSEGQAALEEFARKEGFQLIVTAPAIEPKYDCKLYAFARLFDPVERLVIRGIRVNAAVAAGGCA